MNYLEERFTEFLSPVPSPLGLHDEISIVDSRVLECVQVRRHSMILSDMSNFTPSRQTTKFPNFSIACWCHQLNIAVLRLLLVAVISDVLVWDLVKIWDCLVSGTQYWSKKSGSQRSQQIIQSLGAQ
jgi:hypothetical protein